MIIRRAPNYHGGRPWSTYSKRQVSGATERKKATSLLPTTAKAVVVYRDDRMLPSVPSEPAARYAGMTNSPTTYLAYYDNGTA